MYWIFWLCLLFCFPFFLYESRFCRFSLNFPSLVFYLSEMVVVNDCAIYLSILQTTRITFSAVLYRSFHFFVYNLLLISRSFIRIQFKTLKLVCIISSFVQFSSHSIEDLIELIVLKQFLNYSVYSILAVFFSRGF